MKVRALSAYTREAIARTVGRVEDRDLRAPTWDGTVLHVARLRVEWHVLHEVGHWLCSKPEHRGLPNYGLGQDPDGGQRTTLFLEEDIKHGRAREVLPELFELLKNDPDLLLSILKEKLSREEETAAIVTIILMRHGGLPWKMEVNRIYKRFDPEKTAALTERFWIVLEDVAGRGIDLEDPLRPFEGRTGSRQKGEARTAFEEGGPDGR